MQKSTLSRAAIAALSITAAAALLAGCGEKKDEEKKKATQTAAKVNKEEITVHQINFVLQQQRGLRQDQAEVAGKQALERLIDQELAVQKAAELKLERDPRVLTQLEAAKREIIARAYFDKVGDGAARPSNDDIKAYYDANPALFSQRRVYQLQELAIQAKPEQMDDLQKRLKDAKTLADFVKYLQSNSIPFQGNQAVRPAEQIPLAVLPSIAKMKDGDSIFNKSDKGAQVIYLAASRPQPVDEVRAKPAIEQFLLNERKRKLVQDDLKALRASGKVEYVGKYAEGAPVAQPIAPAPTPAEVAASAAKALDEAAIKSGFGLKDNPSASARPAAPIAEPVTPSASSVDAGAIKKGLGLK